MKRLQVIFFTFLAGAHSSIPNSCLDILESGHDKNGYYLIISASGRELSVFCDFSSESGSAWTLVTSHTLDNNIFRNQPLTADYPVNEHSPNFYMYRMRKDAMDHLRSASTHWRATCEFDKLPVPVDYRDYVRGNFQSFDILTYDGNGICKNVEYLNIRGHIVSHGTAPFWQQQNRYMLHIDSAGTAEPQKCDFDGAAGSVPSEDNFGYYNYPSADFRCSTSGSSTTQYWFGGYMGQRV